MFLEKVVEMGIVFFKNGAGQQHAHRFAANKSGSYHPTPDIEDILQSQVLSGKPENMLIAGKNHGNEFFEADLFLLFRPLFT